MPRKGENIYKRKDGRWEGRFICSYDVKHKAKYAYVYGKSYREVKQKLTEEKGKDKKVEPPSAKVSTYNELLDSWLYSTHLSTKESTQARYAHLINTHIKPQLGTYSLSQLSTEIIIVKSTIEYAKYKELPVICNLSRLSVKRKDKEIRVLSRLEQATLTKVLINEMDRYKFGVILSLYTGIRIGELCALQWEDFCFSQRTLKIRKTMQRIQNTGNGGTSKTKIVISEPKSQCSVRDIPLPSFIVDIAKPFITSPKTYILTGSEQYIEPRTMQNRFKRYIKESQINDANFHALRHTFATRCVEVGFEIKSLSEVLGHANVNITLNRYVHSSFELKRSNMSKLNFSI